MADYYRNHRGYFDRFRKFSVTWLNSTCWSVCQSSGRAWGVVMVCQGWGVTVGQAWGGMVDRGGVKVCGAAGLTRVQVERRRLEPAGL